MARRLLLGVAAAVGVLLGGLSGAAAQALLGDSVTGSGTARLVADGLPEPLITPFEIDARSGPSGEDPTGQVHFSAVDGPAPVLCLEVRTLGTSPPVMQATMNVASPTYGLVTLQVSDGDPEGAPDFISIRTGSPRDPADCSRLTFGQENVRGTVTSGEIDFVDIPPLPTTKEQCRDGGYLTWGFRNQGECIAFVVHGQG